MDFNLQALASDLASSGIKHKVVGMAVRSYKYEGPIIKDVHVMSRAVKKMLLDVPGNMDLKGTKQGKPVYTCLLGDLDVPSALVSNAEDSKYGNLEIELSPADKSAVAWFIPPSKIQLMYSSAGVDFKTVDFRPYLAGFDQAVEHELRHFCDEVLKTHKSKHSDRTHEGSYSEYYNYEHEIDARLTSLFVKVDMLFRGSSLLVLQGKIDSMSKSHHNLLKAGFDSFLDWLRTYSNKVGVDCFTMFKYTAENRKDVVGKCEEFYKFLIEEYGMALRVVKADSVTPEQTRAWKELLESSKDKQQHIKQISKIAGA